MAKGAGLTATSDDARPGARPPGGRALRAGRDRFVSSVSGCHRFRETCSLEEDSFSTGLQSGCQVTITGASLPVAPLPARRIDRSALLGRQLRRLGAAATRARGPARWDYEPASALWSSDRSKKTWFA